MKQPFCLADLLAAGLAAQPPSANDFLNKA